MSVFLPTDHLSITVPVERGGCGEPHDGGPAGERGEVVCEKCEPIILAMKTGAAVTPEGVALTPDEIAETERAERDADRRRNRTWGDPSSLAAEFAKITGSQAPAEAPSLLAQIAALSSEERAALTGMLLASQADTATQPVGDDGSDVPADSVPEKRGPGRPRTRP